MPARGRLIALEGIDGCGKSTQAKAVAAALGAQLTHEPGATPLGSLLRQVLLSPDAPPPSVRAEALLMAADRAEHVAQVIEPALAAGAWVVTDRYSGSTIAYQGYGRGLGVAGLAEVVAWATAGVEADLSVLVDVPVEVAAARSGRRSAGGAGHRMERRSSIRCWWCATAEPGPGDGRRRALVGRGRHGRRRHDLGAYRRGRAHASGSRAGRPVSEEHPAAVLFEGVIGQDDAVAALRAAARNPGTPTCSGAPRAPGTGGRRMLAVALLVPLRAGVATAPPAGARWRAPIPTYTSSAGAGPRSARTPCARSSRWPSDARWPRPGR